MMTSNRSCPNPTARCGSADVKYRLYLARIVPALLMAATLVLSQAACGNDTPQGNALVKIHVEPAGENCPYGGHKVESGIDRNGNGVLDPSEITATSYICDGAPGSDGLTSIINTTQLEPGDENCPEGGYKIEVGLDSNRDGELDPSNIESTWYVCNGPEGTDGGDGADGKEALVNTTPEEPGENCVHGGYKVESGVDANGNGVLDPSEVSSTSYVCNGEPGATGQEGAKALVNTTPEEPGENCAHGGYKVESGVDLDGDGVLDPSEVTSTSYLCNGEPGAAGLTALVELTVLEAGDEHCPAGGYMVESGLDVNGDGVLSPDEVTSTAFLCNKVYTPLVATVISADQIDLSWDALAAPETIAYFDIYVDGAFADYTEGDVTFYSVTDLEPGVLYCFTVVGLDDTLQAVVTSPEVCASTGGIAWHSMSSSGAPEARYRHSVVWTGDKMIVWGGWDGGRLDTGAIYDPIDDTWSPASTVGAPSARTSHSAVWTGEKMLVWGGHDGNYTNTGAAYDPATDSWSPMAIDNAPIGRRGHTAVWTGEEMIVWGGNRGVYTLVGTGGRYNPATDTWETMSAEGAPSSRDNHSAVWTGEEMIIWGGYTDPNSTNTGSVYDPSEDAWTPTTTSGAPSRRENHTAVWTGERMIVWGGYGTSSLRSGAVYDPVHNSWTSITTTAAPSARERHTAVWTGSRMLVWGGLVYGTSEALGDGGAYTPSTNTWANISDLDAPSERYFHTAVWTGDAMVVWGGYDRSDALDDGGIFVR